MWSVARPHASTVRRFLDEERDRPCSYAAIGATRDDRRPAGFAHDHDRQLLGHGAATFARACAALRAWRQFPAEWTAVETGLGAVAPVAEGQVIAVLIHAVGVWWLNSARIVYVIDEPRRFGFAYGTLPGHAECGEERFSIEHLADDSVWYDLRTFSKPRYWAARAGSPLVRALQRHFVRQSTRAMRDAVIPDGRGAAPA